MACGARCRLIVYRLAYAAYVLVCPLFILWLRFAPPPTGWPITQSALDGDLTTMPTLTLSPGALEAFRSGEEVSVAVTPAAIPTKPDPTVLSARDVRLQALPLLLASDGWDSGWRVGSDWEGAAPLFNRSGERWKADLYRAAPEGECVGDLSHIADEDDCWNAGSQLASEFGEGDKDTGLEGSGHVDALAGPAGCFIAEVWQPSFKVKRVLAFNRRPLERNSLECEPGAVFGGPEDCKTASRTCDYEVPLGAYGFCACSGGVFTPGLGGKGCWPEDDDGRCEACAGDEDAGGFTCREACAGLAKLKVRRSLCRKSAEYRVSPRPTAPAEAAARGAPEEPEARSQLGELAVQLRSLAAGAGARFLVLCLVAPLSPADPPPLQQLQRELKPPPFNDRCSAVVGVCEGADEHCVGGRIPTDMLVRKDIEASPHSGFWFEAFVICSLLAFLTSAVQQLPGIHAEAPPPQRTEFFGQQDTEVRACIQEISAITTFSVAAGEPVIIKLRNWLGKVTTNSRVNLPDAGQAGGYRGLREVPGFGHEGMPNEVDIFLDEGHSEDLYRLWDRWASFVATSPDAGFLGRWAASIEQVTMTSVEQDREDPFSPHRLLDWCQLPRQEVVAIVCRGDERFALREEDLDEARGQQRSLASLLPPLSMQPPSMQPRSLPQPSGTGRDVQLGDRPADRPVRRSDAAQSLLPGSLSAASVEALRDLRSEYCRLWENEKIKKRPQGREPHGARRAGADAAYGGKSDDVIDHRLVSFHGNQYHILYVARGKPAEDKRKDLTRTMEAGCWVCLSERFAKDSGASSWLLRLLSEDREEGRLPRSEWELLRTCYAEVHEVVEGAAGTRLRLKNCSRSMEQVLQAQPPACLPGVSPGEALPAGSQPRWPDGPTQRECGTYLVPAQLLVPYIPARGKAGALNFAVRLLHSLGLLHFEGEPNRQSLFAIFDSRHMPYKRFWWWVLPAFFHRRGGRYALDTSVSFVQVPQSFARVDLLTDFLDVTNGLGFNLINQMRNNCGAVTSCGTNAVWLLPKDGDLPHLSRTGQRNEALWWDQTFFEETVKIEDTASSHRLLFEGKHSVYVNPKAEHLPEEEKHAAVVGVAKLGAVYLAAVQRWCEGAVQLFWVTLRSEPRAWRAWAIGVYCFFVFVLLLSLSQFPPNIICREPSAAYTNFCKPLVKAYVHHHVNVWSDRAWGSLAYRPMIHLFECGIWWLAVLLASWVGFALLFRCRLRLLVRYVVIYDNLTYWMNSLAAFFWVALSIYMILGFESPFNYQLFDLLCWIFVQRVLVWTMIYSKEYVSLEQLSLWRSQQAYMVGAPLQIFAILQGTLAARLILSKQVDKSWWKDPEQAVRILSRTWTAFLFLIFPVGLAVCGYQASQRSLKSSAAFAETTSLVLFLMTFTPMLYIWGLMTPRIQSCLARFKCCCSPQGGWPTVLVRILSELLFPLGLMLYFAPSFFRHFLLCKLQQGSHQCGGSS